MSVRREKISELLGRLSAQFLQKESSGQSLITVTGCRVSSDLRRATILISVLQENMEKDALRFVRRKMSELRAYIEKHTKMRMLPFIDVRIDEGEKNRQKIDELSQNK